MRVTEDNELLASPAAQPDLAVLEEMGVTIDSIGGQCPLQAEGTIHHDDHVVYYFRARGEHWSISISRETREMGDDAWRYQEYWPGPRFSAGYMTPEEALPLMIRGISMWRSAGEPLPEWRSREKIENVLREVHHSAITHGWLKTRQTMEDKVQIYSSLLLQLSGSRWPIPDVSNNDIVEIMGIMKAQEDIMKISAPDQDKAIAMNEMDAIYQAMTTHEAMHRAILKQQCGI